MVLEMRILIMVYFKVDGKNKDEFNEMEVDNNQYVFKMESDSDGEYYGQKFNE